MYCNISDNNIVEGYSNLIEGQEVSGKSSKNIPEAKTPTTTSTPSNPFNIDDSSIYNKTIITSLIKLLKTLSTINNTYSDIFTKYESDIKNFNSIIEFGNPKNVNILNFIENLLIKFISLSDKQVSDLLNKNKYCNPTMDKDGLEPENDIIYDIIQTTQLIYILSYFTPINEINVVYINNIIERLSPYFTDACQKVLNGLKLCNPNNTNAYLPLQLIFTKMFKYNKTDVNLGILDGVAKIFILIKDRPTIEIVVIILAVAFIASKIFDMFRVKVEV